MRQPSRFLAICEIALSSLSNKSKRLSVLALSREKACESEIQSHRPYGTDPFLNGIPGNKLPDYDHLFPPDKHTCVLMLTRMRGRGMPGYYYSVPPGQKLSSLFKLTLMGLKPWAALLNHFMVGASTYAAAAHLRKMRLRIRQGSPMS
jgi:hypothetical protein